MRNLKASERRLASIFAGMIFLVANLFVLEQAMSKRSDIEADIRRLKLEKTEADFWLSQKELWTERKAWLDKNQPVKKGNGQESAELLEWLQQSARQQKITIGEQSIVEPSAHARYSEVAVQLQVKGTLEAISRWLASLQQPEAFHAVTNLTLKKDPEGASMTCFLTVAKWYAVP